MLRLSAFGKCSLRRKIIAFGIAPAIYLLNFRQLLCIRLLFFLPGHIIRQFTGFRYHQLFKFIKRHKFNGCNAHITKISYPVLYCFKSSFSCSAITTLHGKISHMKFVHDHILFGNFRCHILFPVKNICGETAFHLIIHTKAFLFSPLFPAYNSSGIWICHNLTVYFKIIIKRSRFNAHYHN